tara:strand:+ start:447 stop:1259 length:813 start_codon:yes stop_codon:yes gene_type:complete
MDKIKNANEIDPKAQPIDRVAARVVYGEAVHFNEKRRQELKIEEGGATWYRDQEAALMHFELPVLIKSEIKRKGDKEDVAGQMQLDQIKQLKTNSFVVLGESPKKRPPRKRWQKERGIGGRRSYIIRCKKCSAHASAPPKYIFKRAHVLPSDLQFCPYCRSVEEIREKMRPKIAPVNSWTTQPLVLDVDELTSGLLKKLNTARANSICKNLDIIGFMKADPLRKGGKRKLVCGCKCGCGYMGVHARKLSQKEILPTDLDDCKYWEKKNDR